MSEKIINLGKVKGRTLELKVEDNIIKKKYDDETEWQPLVDLGEAGSSIDTVSGYSELPTDAKENDVAIVEEEEYVRTENETVVLPIEVKLPTEDQEIPNIYNINFKDKFGTLLDNEELKNMGVAALMVSLECDYQSFDYMDANAELASAMLGVNHPVIMIMQGENDSENMTLYLEGISARDFATMMMELELEEEQWAILLGEHANDSSADNPSYGWIQLLITNEPINENSIDLYGAGIYATVIFDTEAPKFTDILGYIDVRLQDVNGESIKSASVSMYGYYDSYDEYDPEETAFAIKYANLVLNNIAHGGIFEQSNDIYNPKGLFQNDNDEWVSLEEKMNTPRFVDTYADLPKTSIENGIMAVAKESVYESEPTETTVLEMYKSYRLKSIDDITSETINSIIETLLPSYPTNAPAMTYLRLMDMNSNNEIYCQIVKNIIDENNIIAGITFSFDINDNITRRMVYFTEIPFGARVEDMEIFPPAQGSNTYPDITLETGKWYWGDVYDNGKDEYYTIDGIIHEGFPIDEFPDNILFGGGNIEFDNSVYPAAVENYESSDNNYKEFMTLDTIAFHFDDLNSISTITYPAGFYRYNNNEWKHIEDVSGGNFENEDVLRTITATDIGNIQENTEKRHEHSNKSYLDQIQWDAIDKINNQVPQNTNARHTHENKEIIDKLTQNHLDEIGKINNNTTQIEKILEGYNVVYHTTEREPSYVNLVNNHFLYLVGAIRPKDFSIYFPNNGKCGILFSLGGEDSSYSAARKHITFSRRVFWENNIEPPFETFLNEKNPRRILLFFEILPSNYVIGKWFLDSVRAYYHEQDDIENKLLPLNSVSKFAKIENNQLIFAPQIIDNTFNLDNEELYFSKNYKKVYGNNPYELSKTITLNDQFKIYYKEFEDFIYVYWLVTPKDSYIGDYINSSCFENFNNTFQNFEGESINELIYLGELDTSNSTSFERTFQDCVNLKELPQMDTSKAINFHNMCLGCSNLELVPEIDLTAYAISNVTVTSLNIFYKCNSLTTIEKIIVPECNWSAVTSFFNEALVSSLENVTLKANVKLDCDWSKLSQCPNLTVDSLMSLINAFQDNTNDTQYTLTIGATNLAKLTEDQILIATNKNILLA